MTMAPKFVRSRYVNDYALRLEDQAAAVGFPDGVDEPANAFPTHPDVNLMRTALHKTVAALADRFADATDSAADWVFTLNSILKHHPRVGRGTERSSWQSYTQYIYAFRVLLRAEKMKELESTLAKFQDGQDKVLLAASDCSLVISKASVQDDKFCVDVLGVLEDAVQGIVTVGADGVYTCSCSMFTSVLNCKHAVLIQRQWGHLEMDDALTDRFISSATRETIHQRAVGQQVHQMQEGSQEDEVCCVCTESFDTDKLVVSCDRCRRQVHATCWITNQNLSPRKCPLCRMDHNMSRLSFRGSETHGGTKRKSSSEPQRPVEVDKMRTLQRILRYGLDLISNVDPAEEENDTLAVLHALGYSLVDVTACLPPDWNGEVAVVLKQQGQRDYSSDMATIDVLHALGYTIVDACRQMAPVWTTEESTEESEDNDDHSSSLVSNGDEDPTYIPQHVWDKAERDDAIAGNKKRSLCALIEKHADSAREWKVEVIKVKHGFKVAALKPKWGGRVVAVESSDRMNRLVFFVDHSHKAEDNAFKKDGIVSRLGSMYNADAAKEGVFEWMMAHFANSAGGLVKRPTDNPSAETTDCSVSSSSSATSPLATITSKEGDEIESKQSVDDEDVFM